ncbi:hypothetical protein JXI42_10125 [bacterium]|nr:hypothetical protein [bacterium]
MRFKAAFVFVFAFLISVNFSYSNQIIHQNTILEYSEAKVLESTKEQLTLQVQFHDVIFENEEAEKGTFVRVSIPGCGVGTDIGSPDLPVYRRIIEIPYNANLQIETKYIDIETKDLAGSGYSNSIYPVQPSVPKIPGAEKNIEFAYDQEAYSRDIYQPGEYVSINKIANVRGHELALLEINPVKYNPIQGRVQVLKTIELKIDFVNGDQPLTAKMHRRYYCPYFERILARGVINHSTFATLDVVPSPAGYLIITANAFETSIQNFAEWKSQKGFYVTVANISEVGGSSTSQVKSYIQNAYDTWGIPPSFVLLVGNTSNIDCYTGTEANNPATDLYYSNLQGTDYFPDVGVGRFSVSTATQAATMANKIMNYEKGSFPAGTGWLDNAYFMASDDGSYHGVAEATNNYSMAKARSYGMTCDSLYYYYHSGTGVAAAVNNGRTLVVYTGHGSETAWGGPSFDIDDINALSNNNKFPLVCSHSCLTGDFDYSSTSFGEAWARTASKGALGFWGSSVTSLWDEDDILQRRFFDALFDSGLTWFSGMTNSAKKELYDHYGGSGYTKRYYEMYNIQGDPAFDIYTAVPQEMSVSYPTAIYTGTQNLEITVNSASAMGPIGNALVCGYKEGETQGVAYTNASGHATINVNPATAGQLALTVTKHNFVMFQAMIDVLPFDITTLRPFDNEKIGNGAASRAPTLEWEVPDDAAGGNLHFQVQWDNDADFSSPVATIESRLNTTGFSPVPPMPEGIGTCSYTVNSQSEGLLTNGQTYWWRAASYSVVDGEYRPWSEGKSFTVDISYMQSAWFQTTDEQFDKGTLSETETFGSDRVRLPGGASGSVGADPGCADGSYYSGEDYEFYSIWTIPGSGNVTVTTIGFYNVNGSIGTGDQVRMAMYEDGGGYNKIAGSDALLTGTGTSEWVTTSLTIPFSITLGNNYWIGFTSTSGSNYRIYRDNDSNCSGYPPNGVGSYHVSTDHSLNASVPTGASQSDHKYCIPGIAYEAGTSTGFIASPGISFNLIPTATDWEELLFSDVETSGDIKYTIQYWDGDSWENTAITNRDASPVDISGLEPATHNNIRILANFTYSGDTPYLDDWTIKWKMQQTVPITIITSGLVPAYPADIDFVDESGPQTANTSSTWTDSCQVGTTVSIEDIIPGAANVRYATQDSTSWVVSEADTFYVDYTTQYYITVEPEVAAGGVPFDGTNRVERDWDYFGVSQNQLFHAAESFWADALSTLTVSGSSEASGALVRWWENITGTDVNFTVNTPGITYTLTYYHQFLPAINLVGTDAGHSCWTEVHTQFGVGHLEAGLITEWSQWTDRSTELTFSDSTSGTPPRFAIDTTSWTVMSAFRDTIRYANSSNVIIQTSFGGDSVSVDGIKYASPCSTTWAPATYHIIEVDSFYYISLQERHVFTAWSDGGGISNNVCPFGDTTFVANFDLEYRLDILNPGDYDAPAPSAGSYWLNPGTAVDGNVTSPDGDMYCVGYYGTGSAPDSSSECHFEFVLNEPSSVEWRWASGVGGVAMLIVYSRFGAPHPADTVLYPIGTHVMAYVQDSVFEEGEWRYCHGWWGSGSVPPDGTTPFISFTINENSVIVWQWEFFTQLPLLINDPEDCDSIFPAEGIHWYSQGDSILGYANSPCGEMYCIGYYGTGSALDSAFSSRFGFRLNEPTSVTWRWVSGAGGVAQLVVFSEFGSPYPADTMVYPLGTNVCAYVQDSIFDGGEWHYCDGWLGSGSVPAEGAIPQLTFTINENSTIVWQWDGVIRFPLEVRNPSGCEFVVPAVGLYWYNEGTNVEGHAISPDDTMYCIGYYGWGSIPDSSSDLVFDINIMEPSIIEWRWASGAGGLVSLTVYTLYGNPHPSDTMLYPIGTHVFAYVEDSVLSGFTWHYCSGWVGDGSIPASGTESSVGFTISENSNLIWQWDDTLRFPFIVRNPGGWGEPVPLPGRYWFKDGAAVSGSTSITDDTIYCVGYDGFGSLGNSYENRFNFVIHQLSGLDWLWLGESGVVTLEIISAYGTPDPPVGILHVEPGTEVTVQVNDSVISAVARHHCTGWSGTGSVPATGDSTIVTVVVNENSTLTWEWYSEYYLSLVYTGTDTFAPWQVGDGWYEAGSWALISTQPTLEGALIDFIFVSWHTPAPILDSTDTITSVQVNEPCTVNAEYHPENICTIYKSPLHTSGKIFIDGVEFEGVSEITISFIEGTTHEIGVSTPDTTDSCIYSFANWDTGEDTTFITVGPFDSDTFFTANYSGLFRCVVRREPAEDTLGWLEVDREMFNGAASIEQVFWWEEGSEHDLNVSVLDSQLNTVFEFDEWDNGSHTAARTAGPVAAPTTYTAYYNGRYKFTVTKDHGFNLGWISLGDSVFNTAPFASIWLDRDSLYEIEVSTPDTMDTMRFSFKDWDDSIFTSAFMYGPVYQPKDFIAHYRTQFRWTVSKNPPESFGWMHLGTLHFEGEASAQHTFWLNEDSVYIVSVSSPDTVDTTDCIRYNFLNWHDGYPVRQRMIGPVTHSDDYVANYLGQFKITVAKAPAETLGWIVAGPVSETNVSEVSFWGFEGSVYNAEVSQVDYNETEAYSFSEWSDSPDPAFRSLPPVTGCRTYTANYVPVVLEFSLNIDLWDVGLVDLFETISMTAREAMIVTNECVLPITMGLQFLCTIDTLSTDTTTWLAGYSPYLDRFVLKGIFNDATTPPASYHNVRDVVSSLIQWATEGDEGIFGTGGVGIEAEGGVEKLWLQLNTPASSSTYGRVLSIHVNVLTKTTLY